MKLRKNQRLAIRLFCAMSVVTLTVSAYGQASESQPAARELYVPDITLNIEDVAEVRVQPGLPPEAELTKPELAVPFLAADELRVVTPGLPEVLTDSKRKKPGVLGPGLALEASVAAGNNGLLRSSIGLQHAGAGAGFNLLLDHNLQERFGTLSQGFHRTDDLQGAYRSEVNGAEIGLVGRYRRVEDGLQDVTVAEGAGHAISDQLVDAELQISVKPTDVITVDGSLGGRRSSRQPKGFEQDVSDGLTITQWEGHASAAAFAQLRQLEIGVVTDYLFQSVRPVAPTAHRLLGQLELGYDLAIPLRLGARAGLQYASEDDTSNLRIPFEVSVDGMPHDLVTLRVVAGREIIGRDLGGIYRNLKFIDEPQDLQDTRQWFGDASVRAAVSENVHVVASLRGETGSNRVDITGDLGDSGLHQVIQTEAGVLKTGLGLRWDINPTAALNLDWSGAFFDVPLYQAPHVLSLGMRATWGRGLFGVENNVDWVFPNELESAKYDAPNVALPIVSASGFYNVSENLAIVASLSDLLQPLSDSPRYELAPYQEPGFELSLGVDVNL